MPKVHKNILILISGLLWTAVGVFLLRLAIGWLLVLPYSEVIIIGLLGMFLGSIIAYFGFSRIALKNIIRINKYQKKVCIWAFQKWTSYFLIAFMMSLGIFLRNASFISKPILILIYMGIGIGLFLSSFLNYQFLLKSRK